MSTVTAIYRNLVCCCILVAWIAVWWEMRPALAVMQKPVNIFWRADESEIARIEGVPILKQFLSKNSIVLESRFSPSVYWSWTDELSDKIAELIIVRIEGENCRDKFCITAFFSGSPAVATFLGSAYLTPVATLTDTAKPMCGNCDPGPSLLFYDDAKLLCVIHINSRGIIIIPPIK